MKIVHFSDNGNQLTKDEAIRLFIEKNGKRLLPSEYISKVRWGNAEFVVQRIENPRELIEKDVMMWQQVGVDDVAKIETIRIYTSIMKFPEAGDVFEILRDNSLSYSKWIVGRVNLSTLEEIKLTDVEREFINDGKGFEKESTIKLLFIKPKPSDSGKENEYDYLISYLFKKDEQK